MNTPIGIFDSGVGGLTVAREVFNILPTEDVVYLGDVGRYPYGGRSNEIITQFAAQDISFLMQHKVKFIICACNTVSAVALDELAGNYAIQMVGVIKPGAEAAIKGTKNGRIGVIGTHATINSNAYARTIHNISPDMKVFSLACPLFVPLAEEGYIDKEATYLIAKDYLQTMLDVEVDTLILGCTHYPLLKDVIADVMGNDVTLIDSGEEAARTAYKALTDANLLNSRASQHPAPEGEHKFFVSDVPEKFSQVATRFLGKVVDRITRVGISGDRMAYTSVSGLSGHAPRNNPYFVTFREGRDLHFSSGLVDSLYLQPESWWKVEVDRRRHMIRLSRPVDERPDKQTWVKMSRAGRTTKQGRPKVFVRCTGLFRMLKIGDEKARSDVAIETSTEGKIMVFKYKIKGVDDE